MISATRHGQPEQDEPTEFNIDGVVTQEDIDALDRDALTEEELALVDALQAQLDEDANTPPMS